MISNMFTKSIKDGAYSHPNENHARQWSLDGSGLPLSNTFPNPITLVAQIAWPRKN
jgi:hypothetical protein